MKNDGGALQNNNFDDIEIILKLYNRYSEDFHKYTTIIWQFPAAIITFNILAINFFLDKPHILLCLPIINFILLHSLFKQIHIQQCLTKALKEIEKRNKRIYF